MQLAHKTALVTGAASGIGRGIAVALAKRKCNLILTDINLRGLDETAQLAQGQDGLQVTIHKLDVTDREGIKTLAETIATRHNHLDVLVNNAGVALWGTFEQVSAEEFDWLFNINFHGMVSMTRAFLPLLRQSNQAQIVNLSSVFGLMAPAGQVAYVASKFAVRGFSDALRQELIDTNIGVSVVHPGGIATKIADNARPAAGLSPDVVHQEVATSRQLLTLSPETAGDIIVKGIERRKKRILVGNDAKLIALLVRLFPDSYMKILGRFT